MHEQLIAAVRNRTFLYDTNSPDYMKSKLKDKVWNDIAKDLNLKNGTAAKNTWQKLRNCHREALRRQRKCMKSGAPASAIKKWKFQQQMEFLIPYMANRSRNSNLDDDSDYEESQEGPVITESENVENEVIKIQNTDDEDVEAETKQYNQNNVNRTEEPIDHMESWSISSTPSSFKRKRMKKYNVASMLKQSIQQCEQRALKRALEREKLEQSKVSSDPMYHFFMSMYEITKKMSPADQHLVRSGVFRAVSEVEAGVLNITCQPHPQHSQFQ